MVTRSIMQIQEGILNRPNAMAAEAQAEADRLRQTTTTLLAPGMHLEELEINDYPQIARQKITHREPLLQIEEMTGCKLWVKGQHFADERKMPEGSRKLYVE